MKAHAETIPVVVTGIELVTPLIKLFTLRSPDGSDLPAFSGGCHIVVVMPCEGRTHRNPYSLLSSPWDLSQYQIAVFVGSLRRESFNRKLASAIVKLGPSDFTFTQAEIADGERVAPLGKIYADLMIGLRDVRCHRDDDRRGL